MKAFYLKLHIITSLAEEPSSYITVFFMWRYLYLLAFFCTAKTDPVILDINYNGVQDSSLKDIDSEFGVLICRFNYLYVACKLWKNTDVLEISACFFILNSIIVRMSACGVFESDNQDSLRAWTVMKDAWQATVSLGTAQQLQHVKIQFL